MITYGHEIPVKEYNSIRESVGWKVLREEQAQKGLDRSEFLIAAYDGEKAVATSTGSLATTVLLPGLRRIFPGAMRPEYQGRGIGAEMLKAISGWFEDLASDGSCILINLMATKGNEPFYEKFGFVTRPNDSMGAGMVRWING